VSGQDPAYVTRLFGPPAPSVVPGCSECARLAGVRQDLRQRLDLSGVSDVNVWIRDHLAEAHRE
jgi:hypothetical protein